MIYLNSYDILVGVKEGAANGENFVKRVSQRTRGISGEAAHEENPGVQPERRCREVACGRRALHKTDQRTDAVVAVIDTPGALQKQMGAWMAEADIIVIPTRTTSRDIEPLLRMMDIVRANAASKPVLYVLNGWNRWKASSDFRDWFREQRRAGEAKIVTLPQSEQFVQAGAAGVSVVEYAGRKAAAAKATIEMVNEVRVMAGFDPEEV